MKYIRDTQTNIALIDSKENLNYFHQKSVNIKKGVSSFDIYLAMTDNPPVWLRSAFWIRDKISKLAGVKAIEGFSDRKNIQTPAKGNKLDFFDVQLYCENELVLSSVDRHLGVLICINVIEKEEDNNELIITASVRNKNLFGYLYMLPVAPAHSFIISRMMKRLAVN